MRHTTLIHTNDRMQILLAGVILIVAAPIAIQLLLAVLSNPLLAVVAVPAALFVISR